MKFTLVSDILRLRVAEWILPLLRSQYGQRLSSFGIFPTEGIIKSTILWPPCLFFPLKSTRRPASLDLNHTLWDSYPCNRTFELMRGTIGITFSERRCEVANKKSR
jgi:hypothetical protein